MAQKETLGAFREISGGLLEFSGIALKAHWGLLGILGRPLGGWGALRDLWGGLQGALEALESPERSLTEPPKRQCRPSHVQVPREVLPEATQMLPKVMLANIYNDINCF